ncbi:MAG: hypothetical protein U1C33_05755, partial [Candidatus Cloacimonadaceae bacterium]|nr:hypothetical protein [Candidatus Cloacimonadaceae bacterium]
LSLLIEAFTDPGVTVASLMTRITEATMVLDANIVKVITDINDNAIYFSRSLIPYNRDNETAWQYWRHIGVYAYRKEALQHFVSLPPSPLEKIEKLEQLRLIENGISIRMIKTEYQGIGIDTPADLIAIQQYMQEKMI